MVTLNEGEKLQAVARVMPDEESSNEEGGEDVVGGETSDEEAES